MLNLWYYILIPQLQQQCFLEVDAKYQAKGENTLKDNLLVIPSRIVNNQ